MSKIIIGIHGLGNKVPESVLTRWWESSIIEGLNLVRTTELQFDFELVYWAHLMHHVPLDPVVTDKKHPLYVEDPYIPAPNVIRAEKGGELRKKLLDLLGDQLDRIFLNKDLSINFSGISDFIIHHFFSDLETYYNADEKAKNTVAGSLREHVRALLAEKLRRHRRRKILLIAHSMGSIIAWDVLTRKVPEVEIDTLITLGYPLGLPVIRSRINAELTAAGVEQPVLKTPENVKNAWFNLADLRDKIAIFSSLQDNFEPNRAGVRVVDRNVYNNYSYKGEKNPHKAYGYLRTRQLADIIDTFMRRKSPSPLPRLKILAMEQARQWLNRMRHRG